MKDEKKPQMHDRFAALREAARRVKAKPAHEKGGAEDKARKLAAERFGKR